MKSLALSCFICALNLPCSEKLLRKGTNCSRLLEPQELAPNLKNCQVQSGQAYQGIHSQLSDELADVGEGGGWLVGRGQRELIF